MVTMAPVCAGPQSASRGRSPPVLTTPFDLGIKLHLLVVRVSFVEMYLSRIFYSKNVYFPADTFVYLIISIN